MWKPSKEDSLFLKNSVFVGIKDDKLKYYIIFENEKDNVIYVNFFTVDNDLIKYKTYSKIRYYPGYNNLHMKDLFNTFKLFECEYNCEIYFYPYGLKKNQVIIDIIEDIEKDYKENFDSV